MPSGCKELFPFFFFFIHFLCPTGGKVEEMPAFDPSPQLCPSAVHKCLLLLRWTFFIAVSPFLFSPARSPQSGCRCRLNTKNENAATRAGAGTGESQTFQPHLTSSIGEMKRCVCSCFTCRPAPRSQGS